MSTTIIRENGESVTLDITTRESWEHSAEVSEHPVELGEASSDHAQPRSTRFTIRGKISETPSRAAPSFAGSPNRGLEVQLWLEEIVANGELVQVVSPKFGVRDNCVIQRVAPESSNKNAVDFSIAFKIVRIARREVVEIPPLQPTPDSQTGLPDDQDFGVQPTENPASIDESEDASFLWQIGEGLGVF